jgi:hypothetical protein
MTTRSKSDAWPVSSCKCSLRTALARRGSLPWALWLADSPMKCAGSLPGGAGARLPWRERSRRASGHHQTIRRSRRTGRLGRSVGAGKVGAGRRGVTAGTSRGAQGFTGAGAQAGQPGAGEQRSNQEINQPVVSGKVSSGTRHLAPSSGGVSCPVATNLCGGKGRVCIGASCLPPQPVAAQAHATSSTASVLGQ